jgi:hypothetical protein
MYIRSRRFAVNLDCMYVRLAPQEYPKERFWDQCYFQSPRLMCLMI